MSTINEQRQMLAKRFTHTLSQEQRAAWAVFSLFCPEHGNKKVQKDITGKEMYILCNLKNME